MLRHEQLAMSLATGVLFDIREPGTGNRCLSVTQPQQISKTPWFSCGKNWTTSGDCLLVNCKLLPARILLRDAVSGSWPLWWALCDMLRASSSQLTVLLPPAAACLSASVRLQQSVLHPRAAWLEREPAWCVCVVACESCWFSCLMPCDCFPQVF